MFLISLLKIHVAISIFAFVIGSAVFWGARKSFDSLVPGFSADVEANMKTHIVAMLIMSFTPIANIKFLFQTIIALFWMIIKRI